MANRYQAKPGDDVIVTHEKQQLAARVIAVEASGKVDARITARGPYFCRIVKFGPGDVLPVNPPADDGEGDNHQIHGSESYAEMARRVEDEQRIRDYVRMGELGARVGALEEDVADLKALVAVLQGAQAEAPIEAEAAGKGRKK